ncbi:PH domain-containing protein [Nocardioides sp. LS1]|uniref:PH domain-containing protein n=1 Tax=Nocardioides sp. LS1 TaxID=1027620 RepID=UPI000F6260A3|nr:PH domain-containing protein [Nocardioides sp. LS1]GCD92294.1 membrane protein [Nocardioides sp. LS1]
MAISQKLLNDGESVVISTRTHPKALLAPLLWLVLILAVVVFANVKIDNDVAGYVAWGIGAVLVVWLVLPPVIRWLSASYTITNRRLITRTGVLVRKGHDIPLSRISDVAYELGLVDRMLGCGTLVISDASTNGRVSLPDIPHVEETQRRLNQLLHDLNDPTGHHDGT